MSHTLHNSLSQKEKECCHAPNVAVEDGVWLPYDALHIIGRWREHPKR